MCVDNVIMHSIYMYLRSRGKAFYPDILADFGIGREDPREATLDFGLINTRTCNYHVNITECDLVA